MGKINVQNIMDTFLSGLDDIEKEAAETSPEETQPGAKSNMDTEDIVALKSENDGVTDKQTNIGKEQSAEAKAGGATADEAPVNTDEEAQTELDKEDPKTLDVDQPIKDNSSVIGPVKETNIGMEQKIARVESLGNAILKVIEKELDKEAAVKTEKPSLEDLLWQKMAADANAAAQEAFESHLLGSMTRLRDEMTLKEANIDPKLLKKFGGVSGLLDKVAMEDINAVLPEGAAEAMPEGMPAEMPVDEAIPDEVPADVPVDEAMPEDVSEEQLDEIASALDEAGVTPEELEQALTDVVALQEAGVPPEELAQAIEEMNDEDVGGEDMPGEAPVEEEMPEEKVAFDRNRIEMIKAHLRR